MRENTAATRIAIVGGGPAGYEAALVAVELAAEVLLVERDGAGGRCVLSDCVPSKTFIATGKAITQLAHSDRVGVHSVGEVTTAVEEVHARVKALARARPATSPVGSSARVSSSSTARTASPDRTRWTSPPTTGRGSTSPAPALAERS